MNPLAYGETAALLADDPLWLIIVKVLAIFVFLVVLVILLVWGERRIVGFMQQRPGPNRAGPFGIFQSVADALKMAFKEDIRPVLADKWVYFIAPVLAAVPAFLSFSVIPFGGEVTIFGERTALQLVDLPVGILIVLACASVGVYGIVLAGWSSGSPYPLLGALRSAAQVISYEIAMGLAIVSVVLFAGSLSTADIVGAQHSLWFGVMLLPSFVIYVISMVGETNRAPFDLPEAESELVGGFHTEYSTSLKWAMFYLAEYINMATVSALATTMFLGGWRAPWFLEDIGGGVLNTGWWPLLWFFGKTFAFLFFFVWLRGTLPRLRYDQFMKLGWKVLVPAALVWFVAVTVVRYLRNQPDINASQYLIFGGIALGVLIIVVLLIPDRQVPVDTAAPLAGSGYPVPPLNLSVPKPPRRRVAQQAVPAASSSNPSSGDLRKETDGGTV